MIYVVQPGDTVISISAAFNISPDRLRYDNQLSLSDTLVIGQALLVLPAEIIHEVQTGETAFGIAEQYGITLRQLLQRNPFLAQGIRPLGPEPMQPEVRQSTPSEANQSEQPNSPRLSISPELPYSPGPSELTQPPFTIPLTPGQFLVIEYTEQSDEPTTLEGYAYPFIRQNTLRETLPCLHSLYVFSYGFTPTGRLIEPINAQFLVNEAQLFDVDPILVLTPLTETGSFNSNLVTLLVNDPQLQETLITNLLNTCEQMGYTGIDVDFEFIPAENRDNYTTFVARLAERARPAGLTVSVALPPKVSADQRGLLYEGIDYGGLGAVADQVLLMTYEWGYT